MNQLEQLKQMTTVVADTGEIESIREFDPTDATTNPTLILRAAKQPEYRHLIEKAVKDTENISDEHLRFEMLMDLVFVNFGVELLKIVPGRVSTEVDAHLSFDCEKSIEKAQTLISLYEQRGISRDRILIKLASTWEGIRACEVLEMQGIHCNMTLLFSLPQAIACAEAKATLVSPFVGRILDWYKKHEEKDFAPHEDPGVTSVLTIYNYFKKFDYKTQVMGASFRNAGEIRELAGCDLLTIGPKFLEELQASTEPLEHKLSVEHAKQADLKKIHLDESTFRYLVNDDAMATEKLAEGIRKFAQDYVALQELIKKEFL